ncbi:hypothetical protein Z948_2197 [Sulfitobacter donghicola DSW-25 = KCTC 12864 = JCM 14565]|nr:hypothetical protein Z948_2197 [Sulfitobacter donghicola DSW-25 = KCTC 12864 = JCM 14565]
MHNRAALLFYSLADSIVSRIRHLCLVGYLGLVNGSAPVAPLADAAFFRRKAAFA